MALLGVDKYFCVYIVASDRNGTLYVGVTSNLAKRVWEHKEGLVPGFTSEYGVHKSVWYEQHESAESAMTREKRIKKWNREWKIKLIEETNPYWNDLYLTYGLTTLGWRRAFTIRGN